MALKDKTDFIAGIQTLCDGLNAAMADNGGSGMAGELLSPNHPLRKVEKLFSFDAETGIATSDDNYIEESYAGNFPSKGNEFDKKTNPPT